MSLRRIGEGGVYGLSVVLTAVVIGNAFRQKQQFYPAVVYLTKSSPSLAVLAVQALVLVMLMGKLMLKVFFGSLRVAEVEHLIDRSWYAVTETCLAFTVFRDDFNFVFVAMFTMLLFFKCFHWLAEERVDYMERSPLLGCLFHSRILGLLGTLALVDYYFIRQAYLTTLVKGASAQLVFGFEYSILLTIIFTALIKYMLHCIDLYDDNPWENKAVYLLYLELITNGWKFALYMVFVAIMCKVHTFPLFAIRPLYLTMRSFKQALADVILSRRAIRNMNQLYPDATEEDLRTVDDCIICREAMHVQGGCKKLPCSHIFHASCLRSWFQRQQTCPTCRMEVLSVRAQPAAAPAAPRVAAPNAAPAAQPAINPWQAMHAGIAAAQHARGQAAGQPAPAAPPQPPTGTQQPNQDGQRPPAPPIPPFMPGFHAMPPMPNLAPGGAEGQPWAGAMPPPPGMFPFMSMPLPPMPQANLQSLTEEQLRQMEQNERAALEARIQWLRDIQTLIDSAVEQMSQYTQVMSALNASRPPLRPTNQSTDSSQPAQQTNIAEPETLTAGAASAATPPLASTRSDESFHGARPKTITPTAAPRSPTVATALSPSQGALRSLSQTDSLDSRSEQEEVRRRRLAKFQQQHSQGSED